MPFWRVPQSSGIAFSWYNVLLYKVLLHEWSYASGPSDTTNVYSTSAVLYNKLLKCMHLSSSQESTHLENNSIPCMNAREQVKNIFIQWVGFHNQSFLYSSQKFAIWVLKSSQEESLNQDIKVYFPWIVKPSFISQDKPQTESLYSKFKSCFLT